MLQSRKPALSLKGFPKAPWENETSTSRLKRETCQSAGVVSRGPYLLTYLLPRLSPNCSLRNKGDQWGNQPPKGQMVSVQSPPDPSSPCPLWQGCACPGQDRPPSKFPLQAAQYSVCAHMILYYLSDFNGCLSLVEYLLFYSHYCQIERQYSQWQQSGS